MKKINVPEFKKSEIMFAFKKCVVVFKCGFVKYGRIYNFKGKLLGKIPNVLFEEDLPKKTFFAENAFGFKNQDGTYYIKDYDGNVIQGINESSALAVWTLRDICKFEEKSFFEKFKEREIISYSPKAISRCEKLQDGTKLWISPHYLIAKTEKNEIKIYLRNFEGLKLLGTIPESNFKNDESFQTIIENNCHWYGLDHNMLIKEKYGWKIVNQSGEKIVDEISNELVKIFMEDDSKKTDNSDENVLNIMEF